MKAVNVLIFFLIFGGFDIFLGRFLNLKIYNTPRLNDFLPELTEVSIPSHYKKGLQPLLSNLITLSLLNL